MILSSVLVLAADAAASVQRTVVRQAGVKIGTLTRAAFSQHYSNLLTCCPSSALKQKTVQIYVPFSSTFYVLFQDFQDISNFKKISPTCSRVYLKTHDVTGSEGFFELL